MSFGNKLKQIRKEYQLNQMQMSERLCMEQSNLSRYENNLISPSIEIIDRVVTEFNVSREWLLQPDTSQISFQDCSINSGGIGVVNADNYYVYPKEVIDLMIQQFNNMASILEKFINK